MRQGPGHVRLGWHASHEQFGPAELLRWAAQAERAGFDEVWASDHLAPWSGAQGHSGFVWSWLGAALATTSVSYGVVTTPGYRYPPSILAQAIGTLTTMYPGRLSVGFGTGEALNEAAVHGSWPAKSDRQRSLQRDLESIMTLLRGDAVARAGGLARIYEAPPELPSVGGCALTTATARWLGTWAPGLVTVADTLDDTRERVEAYREGAGAERPVVLKAQISYGRTRDDALSEAAEQWRNPLLSPELLSELRTPEEFDEAGAQVSLRRVEERIHCLDSPEGLIEWVGALAEACRPDLVVVHNVASDQGLLLDALTQWRGSRDRLSSIVAG
ncbi:LLM class flavin-dependent oxidoreductase [Aeromicrobium phragmitis]|uniref:LLM class flavin-dependent oxidoreductase n=1 Tax=Aeromicrobium phragmitis TaxID=2478914 RepID=A0A3L8PNY5_9ACTN|nr:LLM class flavin-dependent oxidoreductase [Aeromicrobium phragmitis]RLV56413.1 LLM class flavin-dependent oxidoreductase [Aeromicrobium phragmitis]